ncbi:MAG TPA: DivIVA domain-containing protein [Acidimicrobiales bacterium]|nr:DivIVA domain-containing protein [Acidimicrobiales bacterium]
MDLTPDLLLEAKFAPARRGYDMNEVDDFLERCAEGLDVLLARLRAEFDRAERAEAALVEMRATGAAPATAEAPAAEPVGEAVPEVAPAAAPDPDRVQEPMRILIAAERTAEAAIADARAEAERIRAEAESVASTTRSEAESMLARSRAEAEAEARKAGDETRRSIEAEVMALRQDREVLSEDVASLRSWLDSQRDRLRTAAQEMQRIVDDPEALRELPAPEVQSDDAGAAVSGADEPVADEPPAAPPAAAHDDEVVDARSAEDVQGRLHGGFFDDDEPTQAVPVAGGPEASGQTAVFDDDRAPTNGAFFGSDAIR